MLSPKGAGFLYTRRNLQALVEPLVVSWGWGKNTPYTTGSRYIDTLEWWGTNDPSAYLSVQAAIQFMKEHDWASVGKGCHQMLRDAIQRISELDRPMFSVYGRCSIFFSNGDCAAAHHQKSFRFSELSFTSNIKSKSLVFSGMRRISSEYRSKDITQQLT